METTVLCPDGKWRNVRKKRGTDEKDGVWTVNMAGRVHTGIIQSTVDGLIFVVDETVPVGRKQNGKPRAR